MAKVASTWKRVKFGEVVRLSKETCKDPASAGIERVIGLEHLEPGDLRVRSWSDVADGTTFTNRVRPGQVLFGKRRAYQRKVAVADFNAICSGDIYVFESANPSTLLPELLPFICQTQSFFEHAVGTSAGSLSPRTSWSSLAEYEFALPAVEEQRRIVELLSALAQAAASLETSQRAAMSVRDSIVVGEFPACRNAHARVLSEVCEEITVGIVVKPAALYVRAGEGVPALIMKNIRRGAIDASDLLNISESGHAAHSKSALRAGDVVAIRSSGSIGRTGDAAVVPPSLDGANCIDLLVLRPGSEIMSGYLCEFLNSPTTRAELVGKSSGSMQKHLNVSAVKRLPVPFASVDRQKRFLRQLEGIDAAIEALRGRRANVMTQASIAGRDVLSGTGSVA